VAQFFWSADDYSVGDDLSGIWGVGGHQNTAVAILNDGTRNYLAFNGAYYRNQWAKFLLVDEFTDGEIYAEIDYTSRYLNDGLALRIQDSGDRSTLEIPTGYYDNDVRLSDVDGSSGAFTLIDDWEGPVLYGDVLWHVRHKVAGSTVYGKKWQPSDSEPGWLASGTTAVTAPGRAGLQGWRIYQSNAFRLYSFGVGTGGDPAPTEPVVTSSTPTLSSVFASSITANSAVPNVTVTF